MRTKLFAMFSLVILGAMASAQDMMKPPQELHKFHWMVGRWEGTLDMTVDGEYTKADVTMDIAWDGQFIKNVTNSREQGSGKQSTESSYLGFDAQKKKFFMHTYTQFNPTPRMEWGNSKSSKSWVFLTEPWNVMGKTYKGRSTYELRNNNEYWLHLQVWRNGRWVSAGNGTFRRA